MPVVIVDLIGIDRTFFLQSIDKKICRCIATVEQYICISSRRLGSKCHALSLQSIINILILTAEDISQDISIIGRRHKELMSVVLFFFDIYAVSGPSEER